MSIAAISSSFVAAVRDRAVVAPVESTVAPSPAEQAHREGGRRHELVDAMSQVLGIEGEQDHADEQAVFRFAHALMHDLRSLDSGGQTDGAAGHGQGHAWGRREWNDLPQRIDALATAAAANAAPPSAEPTEPAPATPEVAVELPPADVPPQPNPLTSTSAALHLMQVPSSRLLEAYAALREALGDEATVATSGDDRASLAAFLERLSDGLAPDAPTALPTGSVLNLTA